jgi:hypothetical protein
VSSRGYGCLDNERGLGFRSAGSHRIGAGKEVLLHETQHPNAGSEQNVAALQQQAVPYPGHAMTRWEINAREKRIAGVRLGFRG